MYVINILSLVLTIVGSWKLFIKCGKKGWHSIVPFLSEYQLGVCANREKDGIAYMIVSTLFSAALSTYHVFEEDSTLYLTLALVSVILLIIFSADLPLVQHAAGFGTFFDQLITAVLYMNNNCFRKAVIIKLISEGENAF